MNVAVHDGLSSSDANVDSYVISVGFVVAFTQQLFAFVHHGPKRRLLLRRYREIISNMTICDD